VKAKTLLVLGSAGLELADAGTYGSSGAFFMQWLRRFISRAERADPNILAMPIPPDRFAALRPDDQFIVSYPRSGNTWMRHLMRDVIVLAQPEKPEPESVWMLIPDVHIPEHQMEHPAQTEFGIRRRILKSHHLEKLGGYRLLYIFRNPADTLVSYYHFHRLEYAKRHQVKEGLEAFCEHMVGGWCAHVERAVDYLARTPGEILFISYESLAKNGQETLARAASFLGIEATPAVVAKALERNAFARLREKEERRRAGATEFFFRKGQVGSAADELDSATYARIMERGRPTYERAQRAALEAAITGPTAA